MFKLDLEKAEEPEIKLPTFTGSSEKQESSRKTSTSVLLIMQSLWLCGSQQTGKFLKEMRIPDHLTCLLRNLYAGQEARVRSGHGTTDCFQTGKGIHQAVYCHPAYLTYMQSTSWEMLGWRKHKLESRLLGEISITSDMRMIPPLYKAESQEEFKSFLMKVKEKSEKVGLKFNIQKTKIIASSPITSWHRWGNDGNSDRLYFFGLQNHCRWWLQPWN